LEKFKNLKKKKKKKALNFTLESLIFLMYLAVG